MPLSSPHPKLDIPRIDLLSYLFPVDETPLTSPVKRLGFGLERIGLRKGDVVMIHTPNTILVPVAYLGIIAAGLAFSGANPVYTLQEVAHQIADTGAKVILTHPSMLKTLVAAADKVGLPRSSIFQFSDDGPCPVTHGVRDWSHLLGTIEQGSAYTWKKLSEEESESTVATINYSSGTAGVPKGVCVSHHNLIANVEQTIYMRLVDMPYSHENRPQERWIGFLPLYHAFGQLYAILMAAKLHVSVYIMKQFVYENFLAAIQMYKITHLQVAPPILVMLSKRPETKTYDLTSITDVICGAAPLSKELQSEISKRFHCRVIQAWGMTEVTCGAIVCPGGMSDITGSVGQLLPNTDCKLVDDDETEVVSGEPGELWIRAPQVCLGYWKNEKATLESITSDGWLKTGDIAICNDEGFFWVVDRKKELIKVNALQVSPAELEAVLLESEHIADAAVVGVTLYSEEWPRAYVVLQDSSKGKVNSEDIQEWIKPRVAKHKHLVGGVSFVDEVPKLATGKIQRKIIKDWAKKDSKILEEKFKPRL